MKLGMTFGLTFGSLKNRTYHASKSDGHPNGYPTDLDGFSPASRWFHSPGV